MCGQTLGTLEERRRRAEVPARNGAVAETVLRRLHSTATSQLCSSSATTSPATGGCREILMQNHGRKSSLVKSGVSSYLLKDT